MTNNPADKQASGLLIWSTPTATVGLVVVEGMIVDAPPYARRWAMNRPASEICATARQRGVRLAWISYP